MSTTTARGSGTDRTFGFFIRRRRPCAHGCARHARRTRQEGGRERQKQTPRVNTVPVLVLAASFLWFVRYTTYTRKHTHTVIPHTQTRAHSHTLIQSEGAEAQHAGSRLRAARAARWFAVTGLSLPCVYIYLGVGLTCDFHYRRIIWLCLCVCLPLVPAVCRLLTYFCHRLARFRFF